MVTERDICVLTTHLRDAGCSDVAMAMEMALFADSTDNLGENEPDKVLAADLSLGSLSLSIPKISSEAKDKYRVIASTLLKNSDESVRASAKKLLKALV
jgi:hypothetical protein